MTQYPYLPKVSLHQSAAAHETKPTFADRQMAKKIKVFYDQSRNTFTPEDKAVIADLLTQFKKIADKWNLTYFLISGSLVS